MSWPHLRWPPDKPVEDGNRSASFSATTLQYAIGEAAGVTIVSGAGTELRNSP